MPKKTLSGVCFSPSKTNYLYLWTIHPFAEQIVPLRHIELGDGRTSMGVVISFPKILKDISFLGDMVNTGAYSAVYRVLHAVFLSPRGHVLEAAKTQR